MRNVFEITAEEVYHLRGNDGKPFTEFVDDLLLGLAALNGVPIADVLINQRVNQRDGGVDTQVRQPMPVGPWGFCTEETSWQFKGRSHTGITKSTLKDEINRPYSKKLIEKGYAYRLAIADDMPAKKITDWESVLDEEIHRINADAPKAKVVTAGQLARWASALSGVRLKHFGGLGTDKFLDLKSWKHNVEDSISTFVPIEKWNAVSLQIATHCDLSISAPRAVLCLDAPAGVGKTRLAFETIRKLVGADSLVLYTPDDHAAETLTYQLARDSNIRCILVADECFFRTRSKIEGIIGASRDRVRVIAIDNSGTKQDRATLQVTLDPMSGDELGEVLKVNFDTVDTARRTRYAELSEGFVRVAAILCQEDPLLGAQGEWWSYSLAEYLNLLLPPENRTALEALSLVWRVGWRGEAKDELAALAGVVNIAHHELREQLRSMKDRPGFVRDAGRFMYVTPQIVARIMFGQAWKRWAADDPDDFLSKLPESLQEVFIQRAKHDGSEEVRRSVAAYFRRSLAALTVADLTDPRTAKRVALLVETMPEALLPSLERMLTSARPEELEAIGGRALAGWGGRRHFVWTLERLAWLPELFPSVERALGALAIAESEPGIVNNATGIYCQITRIVGSGTSLPFSERALHLRARLEHGSPAEKSLVIKSIRASFADFGMRSAPPAQIGGRSPEEEWYPPTHEEWREARETLFELLSISLRDSLEEISLEAMSVVTSISRVLLYDRELSTLRNLTEACPHWKTYVSELLSEVDAFLSFDIPRTLDGDWESYLDEVRAWAADLTEDDIEGRLLRLIGRWTIGTERKGDAGELSALAGDLLRSPDELRKHLPWLSSEKARNAWNLGAELASGDPQGAHLDEIISAAARGGATSLARGYCAQLVQEPALRPKLKATLDRLEQEAPTLVYELSMATETAAKSVERVRRLVESGAIPVFYLAAPGFWSSGSELSSAEAHGLLEDITKAHPKIEPRLLREAVRMVAHWLKDEASRGVVLDSPENLDATWRLWESASEQGGGDVYWWAEGLKQLSTRDGARAARAAARSALAQDIRHRKTGLGVLSSLIESHPQEVVSEIGSVLLDKERGWRLGFGNIKQLVASLPFAETKAWLLQNGVEAARRIARHLPIPFVDADGTPQLHPLTELVLERFEADDQVFREFQLGTHSMQWYSGDIAAQHQAEADLARRFRNHRLRRVREWAEAEIISAEADAQRWRDREAEQDVHF